MPPETLLTIKISEGKFDSLTKSDIGNFYFDRLKQSNLINTIFFQGVENMDIPYIELQQNLTKIEESDISIIENKLETSYDNFEPFNKYYIFFYCYDGAYSIHLLSMNHFVETSPPRNLELTENETINNLDFSKNQRFLCVSTTCDTKLKHIYAYKYQPNTMKFDKYKYVDFSRFLFSKSPNSQFCVFNPKLVIGDVNFLICMQRNSPYKKFVYNVDGVDFTHNKIISGFLSKWNSGYCLSNNTMWILEEQYLKRVKFSNLNN